MLTAMSKRMVSAGSVGRANLATVLKQSLLALTLLAGFEDSHSFGSDLLPARQPTWEQQPNHQEPESTISLESDLTDVVFTVTDLHHRFVTDLSQPAIQIFEDGVAQQTQFFGRNNEVPMVLAIVVDFSGSQEFNWPKERQAAQKFLSDFFHWEKDYTAILSFRGTIKLHKGLTNDEQQLSKVLKLLVRLDEGYASQGTSLYDAVYITVDEVLDGPTAKRILTRSDNRVRRAMILITDGHDTSSLRKQAEAIERAQRAGVLLFTIGMSDSFRFADVDAKTLRTIAEQTGGRAYYPTNADQLRNAFKQIAEELSSQYVVGYYPTNSARDGSFRKLEIRILGGDGLTVAHRAGYFALKAR